MKDQLERAETFHASQNPPQLAKSAGHAFHRIYLRGLKFHRTRSDGSSRCSVFAGDGGVPRVFSEVAGVVSFIRWTRLVKWCPCFTEVAGFLGVGGSWLFSGYLPRYRSCSACSVVVGISGSERVVDTACCAGLLAKASILSSSKLFTPSLAAAVVVCPSCGSVCAGYLLRSVKGARLPRSECR